MKRFKFELEPLLLKHTWDIDLLRQEKAMASRAVSEQEKALNVIETEIRESMEALVQASCEDADISITQRQVLNMYLQHQHTLASDARASLTNAQGIEQQISNLLLSTSQQMKTLEKLRENAKKKHEHIRLRNEYNEADENWLAGSRSR